jgi:hypothetical protein
MGKHLWVCGRTHYRATSKNLESKMQLDKHAECALGGDLLRFYKILYLLFFLMVQILCGLHLES